MQAVAATPQHVVGRDEGEEAVVLLRKTRKRTRSDEEEEEAGPSSSKRGAREEEDGEEGGKGDEGSEEGETSSPADDALSGGTATTLRRRRGGGATAARRKTAQRGSRSLSPTSTSSRRRQRVQHRTEEEQPAAVQEAAVEEEQHTTHAMEEEEEEQDKGEAEPDQPPHRASAAPKANNEVANGEEGGVADEEEEGKGVEDAAHEDNESDSADAAAKEEEKSEEEEEAVEEGGAENDVAGSSAMELETQQSNGPAVSPIQNGYEVSSGEPPVTTTSSPPSPKNASPRGAAAATSSTKKADEKSTSPPSQYATRRRTRGMAQEKEKTNGGDFITGQDEIDHYILGCKSTDAPGKDSGEIVGPVLYKPGEEFRGLKKHVGKRLVVHIEAKHITTTNDQVTERQIWGNNGYTADSDLICVLLHTGSLKTITAEPPDYFGIALYMHILPGKSSYVGTKRGTMRSRNWSDHDVTLKLDRFEVLPTKPDDWASSEQVDGAKKSKSKKATATDEGGKSRKRRRKEANDKISPDDAVATEKSEDPEADDAATSTTMTTRSGGSRSRSRPSRSRVSARAPKEELAPLTPAPTPAAKKEVPTASPSAVPPSAAPGKEAATAAVMQEPQADDPDAEAEADEEAGGDEHAPLTTTTTSTSSTANMSRMSTRSGRQPPPASANKKRSRRRPPSGGKSSRSSRSRPQLATASGGGDWEEGRAGRTPASDEGEIDGMKESDGADAPLADESDSDDTALRVKRTKIAGNMKLLEKIARLDRWMPLPTDVMRYNLSYEPCYHYSLGMLADRGFESDFWFSTRLRSFTLYLENDSQRFEFSYSGEATQVEPSVDALLGSQALSFLSFFSPTRMPPCTTTPPPNTNSEANETTSLRPGGKKPTNQSPQDEALLEAENHNRIRVAYGHYRWAEVKHPYSMDRAELKRVGVPLPNDPASVSVLAAELTWEEVAWGEGSVCVRGTTYPVHSLFWMPRSFSASSSLSAED